MVARLCVMVRNAETERCFSCQNHRDVPFDGGPPVRDGEDAETERCFSCQNRIKTKQRCNPTIDHLDQLMRISCSGVRVEELRLRPDQVCKGKPPNCFVGNSRFVKIGCQ